MSEHDPGDPVAVPTMGPGDLYVYSHDNGALYLRTGRGDSSLATLDEVSAAAASSQDAGGVVHAAGDPSPLAQAALDHLRSVGVHVVGFEEGEPLSWQESTTALMTAASGGVDRLLDDMLARGVDPHAVDSSGSTALHHAAANDSVHAIEALVAAGADLDLVNGRGFSPHQLAIATRSDAAAVRLVELGAAESPAPGETRFSTSHLGAVLVWFALPLPVVALGVPLLWPLSLVDVVALIAVLVSYVVFVAPPRAFFAGGAAERLDGDILHLRRAWGSTMAVDLRDVTVAAAGGAIDGRAYRGARWLLLGHPSGTPVTERALRRLSAPGDEAHELAARADRVRVVAIAGGHHDEVIDAVGGRLSAIGVDLSRSLRRQLARGRR